MPSIQQRLLEILDKDKAGDKKSRYCDLFLSTLIVLNIVAICLESIDQLQSSFYKYFIFFEYLSVTIFSIEYLLRIWVSAAREKSRFKTAISRRLEYIFSFTGIIDLVSILPSLLPLLIGEVDLRWLRVLRLFRLLKISHYSNALEDLVFAIRQERSSFGAAIYLFLIAMFVSSALMYIVEHEAQPDNFSSIPSTMWWSLITLTTVGYGDVSPITPFGKLIGAFTAMMGVCVVALLTGIVATAFSNQISRRKDLLEAEILHALDDNEISVEEMKKIKKMQKELHLSDSHTEAIIELISMRKKK